MIGGPAPRQGLPAGLRIPDILNVRDQTDENGRLLLEDSAPKRARKDAERAGVAMKTAKVTYQDTPSRVGGTMNVSAYEALRQDTAEVLDGYAWFSTNYAKLFPERKATPQALYDTSHLGLSLPLILFYRAVDPIPRYNRLPSFVASTFKASRGLFSAALDLLNRRLPADEPLTAAGVVRFAEEEGHLIRSETGRACAAPTRLIERAIAVLLTADGADASQSRLGDLVPFSQLFEFYSIEDAFGEALSRYRFIVGSLPGSGPVNPRELLDVRVAQAGNQTLGTITDSLLQHVNKLQVELNRVLGRRAAGRPLTLDDVLALL